MEMYDHCGERQNLKHILLDCRLYTRERRDLIRHLTSKKIPLTVFNLLQDDTETIEVLIKYLRDSHLIDQI